MIRSQGERQMESIPRASGKHRDSDPRKHARKNGIKTNILKSMPAQQYTPQVLQATSIMLSERRERSMESYNTLPPFGKHRDQINNNIKPDILETAPARDRKSQMDVLVQDKRYEKEQMETITTKNRDGLQTSVSITVRTIGGIFKLPKHGVAMNFPPGAVTSDTKLQISIDDMFRNPSTNENNDGVSWGCITPLVRIEPDDICYQRPVYLIVNHNMNLSPETFKEGSSPIMLHRKHDQAEWEAIPISGQVHMDSAGQAFPLCHKKKVLFRNRDVIIQTESNCDQCAYIVIKDHNLGIVRRAYRMTILVYADYQPAAKVLNVRAFVVHGTADREDDVHRIESKCGSHYLDATVVDVEYSEEPIVIRLHVSSGGGTTNHFSKTIPYRRFKHELQTRTGHPPHVSFDVDLGSETPPNNVRVECSAAHRCEPFDSMSIVRDLVQLTRIPPTREQGSAIASHVPVEETALSPHFDDVVLCLQNMLTPTEKEMLRETMHGVCPDGDFDMMVCHFVEDGDPQNVIEKLERMETLRPEVEQRLRCLIE